MTLHFTTILHGHHLLNPWTVYSQTHQVWNALKIAHLFQSATVKALNRWVRTKIVAKLSEYRDKSGPKFAGSYIVVELID